MEFIESCALCQKLRLPVNSQLKPLVRHIRPPAGIHKVGIDNLKITPKDKFGNDCMNVMHCLVTGHTMGYPAGTVSAEQACTDMLVYVCTFGLFDELVTDPGSNYMSEAVKLLNKAFGIRHTVSLVDRHQSNGVESTNNQILRHLSMIVHDKRIVDRWSSPSVVAILFYDINQMYTKERGCSPFQAKFGTHANTYMRLPEDLSLTDKPNVYLKLLDQDLLEVRAASKDFQDKLIEKRTARTPPDKQNLFQPGDYILFKPTSIFKATKLSPKFMGPYVVLRQIKNDIECKHVVLGSIFMFNVENVQPFWGTDQEAYDVALLDHDQFVVRTIHAYRGNPLTRTTTSFLVEFEDDTRTWLPYSKDLSEAIPFEDFCRSRHELSVLLILDRAVQTWTRNENKKPITSVTTGDKVYVLLRSYGAGWYDNLNLPDKDNFDYVVEFQYTQFNKTMTSLSARCEILDEVWPNLKHSWIQLYGRHTELEPYMRLVDTDFIKDHPFLLQNRT
jgi:hypothetical protein